MFITKEYFTELLAEPIKDVNWFKDGVEPKMKGFNIIYKRQKDGDFGSLNQIKFFSKKMGGNIDFWSSGMLGIYIDDYDTDKTIIDVLLEADQEKEQKNAIRKMLKTILKIKK